MGTPVAVITDEKDDVSLACYMSPSDVRCHLLVLHVTLRCHMLPSGVTCYPLVSHVMLWCHMLFSGVARCCSLVKILSCHAGVCHLEPVKACSRGFQSQTWCTMSQPDRFRRLVMLPSCAWLHQLCPATSLPLRLSCFYNCISPPALLVGFEFLLPLKVLFLKLTLPSAAVATSVSCQLLLLAPLILLIVSTFFSAGKAP